MAVSSDKRVEAVKAFRHSQPHLGFSALLQHILPLHTVGAHLTREEIAPLHTVGGHLIVLRRITQLRMHRGDVAFILRMCTLPQEWKDATRITECELRIRSDSRRRARSHGRHLSLLHRLAPGDLCSLV